jgi:hypothetical protein
MRRIAVQCHAQSLRGALLASARRPFVRLGISVKRLVATPSGRGFASQVGVSIKQEEGPRQDPETGNVLISGSEFGSSRSAPLNCACLQSK